MKKLWIDKINESPEGYIWVKDAEAAKGIIEHSESRINYLQEHADAAFKARDRKESVKTYKNMELYNIDAISVSEEFYEEILNWLKTTNRNYSVCTH